MYHALTILLSRPFLSEGHLQALSKEHTGLAFTACVTAATEIDAILRLYKTKFCLKTCPYFISYATYASGTIHARVAAQRPAGSQSQQMLRHCLEVLSEQQKECHAPRQSMKTLLGLAKRLSVDVGVRSCLLQASSPFSVASRFRLHSLMFHLCPVIPSCMVYPPFHTFTLTFSWRIFFIRIHSKRSTLL